MYAIIFYMQHSKKGFTLIELLIVIGILAVLSSAVVIVLNPTQLFAQARDSQRLSDLESLSKAIYFYIAFTAGQPGFSLGSSTLCYPSIALYIYDGFSPRNCDGRFTEPGVLNGFKRTLAYCYNYNPGSCINFPNNPSMVVTGAGWLPINLASSAVGSLLVILPVDPINKGSGVSPLYFYAYGVDTATSVFELNTKMESIKFKQYELKDGGNDDNLYEVGSRFNL